MVKGSGPEAFSGPRVIVDITATNAKGEHYGAGPRTMLHPESKYVPSGKIDEPVFTGRYGMKVGGTRRITLPSAKCQGRRDQPCELAGANPGEAAFQYANGAQVTFTVTLVSVCRPYIVEKTTYSIPVDVARICGNGMVMPVNVHLLRQPRSSHSRQVIAGLECG